MPNKKVWFLISDGLGVRNFAYNGISDYALEKGFSLTYWNNTVFSLEDLGLNEVQIESPQNHPLTDVYKKAIKEVELSDFYKRTGNSVYNSYRFPFVYKGIKSQVKEWMAKSLEAFNTSEKGLKSLRRRMKEMERKTDYYERCYQQLKESKPDIIFNSSQRHISSLAPILAAQDLGIPTVTFIFSWDNLPKSTLVVESDYYFVWSEYMKEQLLFYYPFIESSQVHVTGTPQFDWHVQPSFIQSREDFFASYDLDPDKDYICYSGDDVVTSPNDPKYLRDLADAVRELNQRGNNIGILFRRCPVDFSSRFDTVETRYNDVIFPIRPRWKKMGKDWNFILPEKEDLHLLSNVCEHTMGVVNVGSSMVFDFYCHGKPCYFLNYNVEDPINLNWKIEKIYKYIHFESMPSQDSVGWVNDKNDFHSIILENLEKKSIQPKLTKKWFEKITAQPIEKTSDRFMEAFSSILKS